MALGSGQWVIEAIRLNNGYGMSRLLGKLHEKFPKERDEWSSLEYLRNFILRADHQNTSDGLVSSLYDDIQTPDEGGRKHEFLDPDEVDSNSIRIITPSSKTPSEKKKKIAPKEKSESSAPEGTIGSRIPSKLKNPKHKIAWLLLSAHGDDSLDYYSSTGATVVKRYWTELASKLSVELPKSVTKPDIPKHIFDQCQVSPSFEPTIHLGGIEGGTISKTAFVDLCDFFGIRIPADLVTELEEQEENLRIVVDKPLEPVLKTEQITIKELIEQYTGGLIFTPDFQRGFRWPIAKQRELIESVLIGIPLPTILLIKEQKGDWWLVDGRQRVTTLRRFIDPKNRNSTFHLGLLEGQNSRYSNLEFSSLPDAVQERILETEIPITRIDGLQERRDAVYELFRRYNTGGTNLNGAEIRHAVFHENPCHQALFRLAGEDRAKDEYSQENKRVRELLRVSKKGAKGFATYDKICRYFGYKYSTKGMTTSIAIHNFFDLNDSEERAKTLAQEFIETAEFCNDLFGRNYRFSKIKEDGTAGSFAAWAYTIQMIGSRYILDSHPDKKSQILDKEGAVIPMWDEFYMEHVFNQRQNSTTLWGSQEEWVRILGNWIDEKFTDSEYEVAIREISDMEPKLRRSALDKLKKKPYYSDLIKEAKWQGWI